MKSASARCLAVSGCILYGCTLLLIVPVSTKSACGGCGRVRLPLSKSLALNYTVPTSQTLLFPDPRPLVERMGQDFFRQLTERPGVYLMQDAAGVVLYVGKAKNLRQRL